MATLFVTALAAAVAALVASRLLAAVTGQRVLSARNHRGLSLPVGSGIAILGGSTAGWGTLSALGSLASLPEVSGALSGFVLVALGFGFIGLYDDLAGSSAERGWRAHIRALLNGRATPGALKLVGGMSIALVAVPSTDGFVWGLARAALIALSANLLNMFDLRPGRASKVFILAAAAMSVMSVVVAAPLAVAVAAVAVCLRADLRERVMMGDAGANALGAILGAAGAVHASHLALLIALGVLVGSHAISDRPGLSALIDAIAPLRAADRAGRVITD